MDEVLFKILSELLNGLEESVKRAKEELLKYIEKQVEWRVIKAERACNPDDRALKWLERKLAEIKAKHSDVQYEFLKSPEGYVLGLRYYSQDPEALEDVESVASWAFSKASQRPITGSQTGGNSK